MVLVPLVVRRCRGNLDLRQLRGSVAGAVARPRNPGDTLDGERAAIHAVGVRHASLQPQGSDAVSNGNGGAKVAARSGSRKPRRIRHRRTDETHRLGRVAETLQIAPRPVGIEHAVGRLGHRPAHQIRIALVGERRRRRPRLDVGDGLRDGGGRFALGGLGDDPDGGGAGLGGGKGAGPTGAGAGEEGEERIVALRDLGVDVGGFAAVHGRGDRRAGGGVHGRRRGEGHRQIGKSGKGRREERGEEKTDS